MLVFVRAVGAARVPELVGLEISAARVELERAGYATVIEREIHTPNLGDGRVVSQRPGPGHSLRRGRKVHLTLSLGRKETQLPRVTGLTLRQASLELQRSGFAEGGILRVDHPSIEKGAVIAQDPPAGALGTEGEAVDLLVSTGSAVRPKRVPEVVGLAADEAEPVLRAAGFVVFEKMTRKENSVPEGTVLDQFPSPGSPLPRGEEVNLTISTKDENQ
jgi:serine/threonine-protein kinase